MDPLDPDVRDTKRRMFGMAEQVGFDGQGRINIPVDLLEFAGLTKEVVVIGTGDVIEIWDADAWRAKRDHIDVHAVEIMRRAGGGSST
jgi:division/cell wall cluster transcriptional repressor MraZ